MIFTLVYLFLCSHFSMLMTLVCISGVSENLEFLMQHQSKIRSPQYQPFVWKSNDVYYEYWLQIWAKCSNRKEEYLHCFINIYWSTSLSLHWWKIHFSKCVINIHSKNSKVQQLMARFRSIMYEMNDFLTQTVIPKPSFLTVECFKMTQPKELNTLRVLIKLRLSLCLFLMYL